MTAMILSYMRIKEEPQDPEYNSCQYGSSDTANNTVSQISFNSADQTDQKPLFPSQESVAVNLYSTLTYSLEGSVTDNVCPLLSNAPVINDPSNSSSSLQLSANSISEDSSTSTLTCTDRANDSDKLCSSLKFSTQTSSAEDSKLSLSRQSNISIDSHSQLNNSSPKITPVNSRLSLNNSLQKNVPINPCSPSKRTLEKNATINSYSTEAHTFRGICGNVDSKCIGPELNHFSDNSINTTQPKLITQPDEVLINGTQHQLDKQSHLKSDHTQCISDTFQKEQKEVSHALPRRIAQLQQKLQPCSAQKRRAFAQPKDSNDIKRIKIQNTQEDSNIIKHGTHISKIADILRQSVNALPSRGSENSSISNESGDIKTCKNYVKGPSKEEVLKSTYEHEPIAMSGLFGWTLIDNVYIPYIFREDNEKYVCVRFLEYKILRKFPNVFPKELAMREPLSSSFIKPNECRVFNYLVGMQYKGSSGMPFFNQDDVVVLLSEFLEFYDVVKNSFPECAKLLSEKQKAKSGWFQVNNTIIPFISRYHTKLLPLAVLKHAASIVVSSDGVTPTEEECKELNKRCEAEGFNFSFKPSSRLVSLSEVEKVKDIQVFELPEKDPLHHAQYLNSDNNDAEGMRINTHEKDVPNIHAFERFSGEDATFNSFPEFDIMDDKRDEVLSQEPVAFSYRHFPHSVQYGDPNVTLIPRQPLHISRLSNVNKQSLVPNMRQMSSVGIIGVRPPPAHCGQRIVPGTFLNGLSPGQNINVNYGINIQNITPAHNPRRLSHNNYQIHSGKDQIFESPVSLVTNVKNVQPTLISPSGGVIKVTSNDFKTLSSHTESENMSAIDLSNPCVNMRHNSIGVLNLNANQAVPVYMDSYLHRKPSNSEQNNLYHPHIENTIKPYKGAHTTVQQENTYQMKQKQAVLELLSNIKGVWLCGKNISCLHLNKPGRTGKFCLVEAVCKLYYSNRTVSEFLFTIDKVLMTVACTELEEQAFIEYYQLPVNVLKCNKMVELSAFERLYPQLTEVLSGVYPHYFQPPSNTRCLLPLPDSVSSHLPRNRTSSAEQNKKDKEIRKEDLSKSEDKVIVLDG